MRLRQIEVFDAVYSSGSVTRAAERLCVSQPSISKVLSHTEQQLGYALFDRVKGRLIPTAEADRLYSHVKSVNQQVDQLRKVAKNLTVSEEGTIRVAATPAFGIKLLPRVIAQWNAMHPETFFSISTRHHNEINRGLLESRFDIGLAFEPAPPAGIHAEPLHQGQLMVLAPKTMKLPDRPSLSLQDLGDHPFIGLDQRGPLGVLLADAFKKARFEPRLVAEAETYHVAKTLAEEGVGLTITDEVTAISGDNRAINFWPLKPRLKFAISALTLDSSPLPRISQEFLGFLKTAMPQFFSSITPTRP